MASIRDVWLHANNIIRSGRQIANAGLKPLGLSSAEGNILLHMIVQKEALSQEQLVNQLEIDKAAISRAADSLERKGYVIRQKRTDDKRTYQLSLTEKALGIAPQIEQVYDQIYSLALQDITPKELTYLIKLLSSISQNLTPQ